MLLSRCAWHPRYFGHPLVGRVVSWSGWSLRFTDGICPECATRFRAEYRAFVERRLGRDMGSPTPPSDSPGQHSWRPGEAVAPLDLKIPAA